MHPAHYNPYLFLMYTDNYIPYCDSNPRYSHHCSIIHPHNSFGKSEWLRETRWPEKEPFIMKADTQTGHGKSRSALLQEYKLCCLHVLTQVTKDTVNLVVFCRFCNADMAKTAAKPAMSYCSADRLTDCMECCNLSQNLSLEYCEPK